MFLDLRHRCSLAGAIPSDRSFRSPGSIDGMGLNITVFSYQVSWRSESWSTVTSVLIVEDEESLADPLAFLLRKEGFEATVVTDGPSALAEFDLGVPLHRVARPDVAGHVGHRRVQAIAFAFQRAGHHGDRA